ncbi:MAG: hypothetical protein OXG27_00650 [Chloroflexi bacterium]|nr:hypothetical protein [Chloroflexota bacterium]
MTTQQDAFDERLTHLEGEVRDIKTLLGENALVQSQILNLVQQQDQRLGRVEQSLDRVERRLDGVERRVDRVDRRTEDIARHLGVPPRNGTG